MDGVMYRQGQGIENVSWMGILAWQWPKTHGQGNKGVTQEEAGFLLLFCLSLFK